MWRNFKQRGIKGERELFHKLQERGFTVARVAGSGSVQSPSCDLLAGNGKVMYAIECKTTVKNKIHISKRQIDDLKTFAKGFGLKPIVFCKFIGRGWRYLFPHELIDVGTKNYLFAWNQSSASQDF